MLFEYTDSFVVSFFDDILIYSGGDLEDHLRKIQLVLNKLREAQLFVNPEKCTFFATSVPYLGHEISAEGVRCSTNDGGLDERNTLCISSTLTTWYVGQNERISLCT